MSDFPWITTAILQVHKDEVWNIKWSHDGAYLASASKDKSAIIWRRRSPLDSSSSLPPQDQWATHHILPGHSYSVSCLAWSLDDTILLTSTEHLIKLWNKETGVCIRTLEGHTETVTAISWLPDGSGFISGGSDRKIIIWDAEGKVRDAWDAATIRLTELALTPDSKHLVAVGIELLPNTPSIVEETQLSGVQAAPLTPPDGNTAPSRMIAFDLATKQTESTHLEGEFMNMQITQDSQHALINHPPNVRVEWLPNTPLSVEETQLSGVQAAPLTPPDGNTAPSRVIVFDLATKQTESSTRLEGELTSMQITQDSQYALINHSPNEIYLWDIHASRVAHKYSGHSQDRHVIRSCFGGGNFVISGSEDGKVYIWDCDTSVLLEVLTGHGEGSVNAVAWNPTNEHTFASCSDDHNIRIWERAPSDSLAFTYDGTSTSALGQ